MIESINLKILATSDYAKFNIILLSIFLYPLILIFQGGDLTDTGFLATNYFFFFENINNGFARFFLTNFIGAMWIKLFPGFGILGLRFLYLVFLWLSIIINYHLLRDFTKSKVLLLFSFFVSTVFLLRNITIFFDYDIASWAFISLANILLVKGNKNNNQTFFLISGIAVGIAMFCKISSLACLLLFILGLIYFRLKIKFVLSFIFGFFLLVLVVFLLMDEFKVLDSYLKSISKLFGLVLFKEDLGLNTSHSNLISIYVRSILYFIPFFCFTIAVYVFIIYSFQLIKNKSLLFILILIIFSLSWYIINNGAFRVWNTYLTFSYLSDLKYIVSGLCLLPLIYGWRFSGVRFVLLILFLSVIGQVLGTNTGLFFKLCYGLTALIPLAVVFLEKANKSKFLFLTVFSDSLINFFLCFILFFSVLSTIGFIYHVEYGIASRTKCTYVTDNPKMTHILTTKENKEKIEVISESITKNLLNFKEMYIFGHQPLFYYLTEKKPAIKNYWLSYNCRTADGLFYELKDVKPVIIDTKEQILGESGQKKLLEFLNKHHYKLKEKNKFVNIWTVED